MRAGFYDHHEPGGYITATANASGIASGSLGPVAQGYCWYVERLTAWSNTSQTAPTCEIFVQQTEDVPASMTATVGDRAGRQDVSVSAANDVSDQESPIFVPEGYFLVAFWSGFTSGDTVQLSSQIAVHLLSLDIEPRQMIKQQVDPTPDINPHEVAKEDGLIARLEHATDALFAEAGKVI